MQGRLLNLSPIVDEVNDLYIFNEKVLFIKLIFILRETSDTNLKSLWGA